MRSFAGSIPFTVPGLNVRDMVRSQSFLPFSLGVKGGLVAFKMWRGSVGIIKPTRRIGSMEQFCRLLPEGIGVLPMYLNIREGTTDEFKSTFLQYEEVIRDLVEAGVDLIHPEGAPVFMVQGLQGEKEIVGRWEEKFGIPVITAPMTQLEAMRALGMQRIVGISYFSGEINKTFARYFEDAGIEVAVMAGMEVPFNRVQWLSSREVYAFARDAFLGAGGADGIYLLGSGWDVLDMVEMLEQDMGVPVIHAVTARIWAIQYRLHVHEKTLGYGRLLAELPVPSFAVS